MSPSLIWSDKITNEHVARAGYNHSISKKGEWNNIVFTCISKFSNRVLPPIFISTILQSGKFLNLAHYFLYDAKLRLLAHGQSFLANQKARNAIVGAENLPNDIIVLYVHVACFKETGCTKPDSLSLTVRYTMTLWLVHVHVWWLWVVKTTEWALARVTVLHVNCMFQGKINVLCVSFPRCTCIWYCKFNSAEWPWWELCYFSCNTIY